MQTPTNLARHILELAGKHCIDIDESQEGNWANPRSRWIALEDPLISTPVSYALAMHELGHIVGPNQLVLTSKDFAQSALARMDGNRKHFTIDTLQNEVNAWRWAKQHAILWNEAMQTRLNNSLLSYARPSRWRDIPNVTVINTHHGIYKLEV